MTDFKLSCCRLFEKYPLYGYRDTTEGGEQSGLNVLIVGSGSRAEVILEEVLIMGQLPDTELDVTVVTQNGRSFIKKLTKKAPYLHKFARIYSDGEEISSPEEGSRLCTLRTDSEEISPESMEVILQKYFDCSYIFISTGKEELNCALAEVCARYTPDRKTLAAFVCKKARGALSTASALMEVIRFGAEKEDKYRSQLDRIALNLHYAYSKAQDERKTPSEILSKFREPYYYAANIRAALHIRSKLACVGICDEDLNAAAEKFALLLKQQPEILDRLSVTEHCRWVMAKLLQGYVQLEDIDRIYRSGNTTHSADERWHCCLLPCDRSGRSRLREEDWEDDKEIRPDLDPLDSMSIKIHRKCGERVQANKAQMDDLLRAIRTSVSCSPNFSRNIIDTEMSVETAITQMRLGKRTAVPIYRRQFKRLCELVEREDRSRSSMLLNMLSALDAETDLLCEYISDKDYKYQDRLMINQIPFALTHRFEPVIIKIMSEKNMENLFSTWQLDPKKLVCIGWAETVGEVRRIRTAADNISVFTENSGMETEISYCILMPGELCESARQEVPDSFRLFAMDERSPRCAEAILSEIMASAGADYLDVTGGEPLLSKAAETAAERLGISSFYVRSGRMNSLRGARELEYDAPVKNITVREMFSISGTVLEESETTGLSDLSLSYPAVWALAKDSPFWHSFCNRVASAYSKTQEAAGRQCRFAYTGSFNKSEEIRLNAAPCAVSELLTILDHLEKCDYIENIEVENTVGGQQTVSFILNENVTSSAKEARDFLQRCCDEYHPNRYFHHRLKDYAVTVTYADLYVRDMPLGVPGSDEYRANLDMLSELSRRELLLDYERDAAGDSCSFRFASRDVLSCLQVSGSILEYVLYYTALLDAHFTDADMGYKFLHSAAEDAAENEIDVLCTRGTSSLFISAKFISEKNLKTRFNFAMYEILFLAERFGMNAKVALAAPVCSLFEQDDSTGEYVLSARAQLAMQRGVYLLGRECFENGALARVLDNIMDGRDDWCDFLRPKN